MSTGLLLLWFGFAKAVVVVSDRAEHDRPVADGPTGSVFLKRDRFAGQRLVEVDRLVAPAYLAVVTDLPHFYPGRIFRLAQDAVEAARRWRVEIRRRGVIERLMRTLLVVDVLEVVQPPELLAQGARWRRGGIPQQRQVHALMPAVLLRLAGLDALWNHAGLDQLDRQPRQSAGATRGKRRAVVGSHVMRKPELAECRIQHRPDMIGVGARQRLTAQQIAAMRIRDRQRLAALAVPGHKPALEVDAPHLVGGRAFRKRRARGRTAPAQLALHRQPFAIEQRADRARRRPLPGGRLAP